MEKEEEKIDRIFMHSCCGPCSIYCIDTMQKEGAEVVCYWYNINIHPYTEYKNRKESLEKYLEQIGVKLVVNDDYGLLEFLGKVGENVQDRCGSVCYSMRLEETARKAKELRI